jgi:hypothetical protein
MALDSEQVRQLFKMIRQTRDLELSCPECLDELDKYTQRVLDGTRIDEGLDLVRQHLEACSCCNDQFKLILETLNAIEGS